MCYQSSLLDYLILERGYRWLNINFTFRLDNSSNALNFKVKLTWLGFCLFKVHLRIVSNYEWYMSLRGGCSLLNEVFREVSNCMIPGESTNINYFTWLGCF